jgi:hypothetical protein
MNMTMTKFGITAALATLVATGCATHKTTKMVVNPYPAQATVQVIPPQGKPEPKVATIEEQALPAYVNPVLEEVEMAEFVDSDGQLHLPSKMLVIRTPGHWNLEAAKRGNQYYIPADNMPTVLAPPSKSYYDYITAKKNGAVPTASLDVSAVHVTGFTLRSEEDQAKAVLKPGETLSFDPYLGWIAIPTASLQPGGSLSQPDAAAQTRPMLPPQKAPEAQPNTGDIPVPAAPTPEAPTSSKEQEVKQILDNAFKDAGAPTPPPTPKN